MLPTQHELIFFLMGFAGGSAFMGSVWFILHIRRVLNAPQKFMEECLAAMRQVKTNQ
jgi:hypothetical protein